MPYLHCKRSETHWGSSTSTKYLDRVDQFEQAWNSSKGKPAPGRFRNGHCPLHPDRKASAYWSWDFERGITLGCHVCGNDHATKLAMLGAMGLPWDLSDLSVHKGTTKDSSGRSRIELARYSYTDRHGVELFTVVRFFPKEWATLWPDPKNRSEDRPLFHLPEVIAEKETVYLCEGEKDALALVKLGLCGTTTPFGAAAHGMVLRDQQIAPLMGKQVRIVVDRDQTGYQLGMQRAAQLANEGIDVEVLEPAEGNDLSDHLGLGRTVDELIVLSPADLQTRLIDCDAPATLAEVLHHLPTHAFSGRGRSPQSLSACMLALLQVARREGRLDDLPFSVDQFEQHTPMGRATVSRTLSKLVTMEWLTRVRPPDDEDGRRYSYRYTITPPTAVLSAWRGGLSGGTHCASGSREQGDQRIDWSLAQPHSFPSPVVTRSVPPNYPPNCEAEQLLTADLGHDAVRNSFTDPAKVSHAGIGLRGEQILQHLATDGAASTNGLIRWLRDSTGKQHIDRASLNKLLARMENGGLIARNEAQLWEALDTTIEGHDEAAKKLGTSGARSTLAAKAIERKKRFSTWGVDKAIQRLLEHSDDEARFVEMDEGILDTLTGELLDEDDIWDEIMAMDKARMAEIDPDLLTTTDQ